MSHLAFTADSRSLVTADRWTVDAGIDNLTNKTYRRHLSQLNDPGRNVRMQAIYRF